MARFTYRNLAAKMASMPSDDAAWRRLAEQIRSRRTHLGMTQTDVASAGGPSTATVRQLESAGATSYRPAVLARLERALRWQPGSVEAVLAGSDPTLAEDRPPPVDATLAATVAALDDEAVAAVLRNNRIPEEDKRRLVELLIRLRREDQQRRVALAEELTRPWGGNPGRAAG